MRPTEQNKLVHIAQATQNTKHWINGLRCKLYTYEENTMHYDMQSYESLLLKSNGMKERNTCTESKGKVLITNSRARSCIVITVEVQYSGPLTPKTQL